ncbi:MAG: NAD(P)H-dependent oxidoreductase [Peptococcia bacterium]
MKITVIHGQGHKGSTYHITRQIIDNISDTEKEVFEYFMPLDTPDYCVGCYQCFDEGEETCSQADKVQKIVKAMEESNLIIIDSPTYCLGMTGQLKTFFDHLGYMWLSHRPKKAMFNKIGIAVSTAAGSGSNKVTKDLARQMFYLGIPKVYRYGKSVNAANWESVPKKIKKSIARDIVKLSKKVEKKVWRIKPGIRLRLMFNIMRLMQKSNDWNLTDRDYWQEKGWLGKKRPWQNKKKQVKAL